MSNSNKERQRKTLIVLLSRFVFVSYLVIKPNLLCFGFRNARGGAAIVEMFDSGGANDNQDRLGNERFAAGKHYRKPVNYVTGGGLGTAYSIRPTCGDMHVTGKKFVVVRPGHRQYEMTCV